MSIAFVVLSLTIGGYMYLTDSDRVRSMAEAYLSHLLGGRVEIGRTTLSIFEGLRLDDVKVHVDPGPGKPDSLLFSAQSFVVNYDPRKLIEGQLEAGVIIAQKPHVYLTMTQSAKGDEWNYHRLGQNRPPPSPGPKSGPTKIALPEILLRNAVVEISEVKAGQRCRIGSMALDGQLTPVGDGQRYQFEMQSRGISEGLGPYADGAVNVETGELTAHLRNVRFSNDIRSMFPTDLRDWWERHELAGRVESVDLYYCPPHDKIPQKFSVQTTLKGVTLAVRREEWSSHEEVERWQRLHAAIAMTREPYRIAGYSLRDDSEEFGDDAAGEAEPGQAGASPADDASVEPAPESPMAVMSEMADTSPLLLREVSGTFVFNQDGIDVNDLLVRLGPRDPKHPRASNAFRIDGHMEGYRPDAPLRLQVGSADPQGLYFPGHPKFLDSLPREVRDFYQDLKPEGTCRVWAEVDRPLAGAVPQVAGQVEIVNAQFRFRQFPYPFRGASGKIAFGRDLSDGKDYIRVLNMHGSGMIGGPNENAQVAISGRVGPLGPGCPEPGFQLRATGTNICSEPQLMAAMPREVRLALQHFDAPGKGEFPQFKGNFVCNILRPPGPRQRWTFETDLDLQNAAGRVVGFPYPCRNVHGKIEVHDGYVDVVNVTMRDHAATATVNGTVRWADATGHDQPLDLKLNLDAHGIPVNEDLLSAMPPEQSQWLRKLGIGGNLDARGTIFTIVPPDWKATVKPGQKPKDPPALFDLMIGVRDGTIWPADGLFCVSGVAGKLHLTHDRLDILDLHGRREKADVSATGSFTFTGPTPRMAIHVVAHDLAMDRPLYAMIPPEGRRAWDEVRPEGAVDADIDFRGPLGPQAPPVVASASPRIELPTPEEEDGFRVVLKPRKLLVRVKTAPYPLTFSRGTVTITPGKAVLKDLVGMHGGAKLLVSGDGSLGAASAWNLALHAENVAVDAELQKAMPPVLLDIVNGLKLRGTLGFDFPKLSYRGPQLADADPDIDVSGTVSLKDGSMDAGMPLTDIQGGVKFSAVTRQGKFDSLTGRLSLDTLNLGGRPVRNLRLDLVRVAGKNDLHIDNIRAKVAGGELAGGILIGFPDQGPRPYTMNLIVRNADVKELAGETDQDIRGELTASLSLEGKWGDSSARRGRGDVVVAGKQLYRIPLMLGLLQVTDLSLPIGQPFTKATARYTVDGTRVNFEQMDLHADAMTMSGTGYLDFATKQVRMSLTTDNPGGFKIPFISDLWQGARQELLRINVQGTVQEPKVQPTSMGIFTTTIDQVFKGDSLKK